LKNYNIIGRLSMTSFLFAAASAATTLLGLFWVLKKLIGVAIPASIGIFFIYLGGLIVALMLSFFAKQEWQWDPSFKKGILLAFVAGVFIALSDALGIFLFQKGANLTIITPIVSGGAVALAVLIGFLFFKESLSLAHFIGIVAVIAGIFLLSK